MGTLDKFNYFFKRIFFFLLGKSLQTANRKDLRMYLSHQIIRCGPWAALTCLLPIGCVTGCCPAELHGEGASKLKDLTKVQR